MKQNGKTETRRWGSEARANLKGLMVWKAPGEKAELTCNYPHYCDGSSGPAAEPPRWREEEEGGSPAHLLGRGEDPGKADGVGATQKTSPG